MAHAGGRPTLYRPEYCQRIVEFCAQGYSLTAFAGEIGVGRNSITEWTMAHPEFSVAVARAKALCGKWWEERGRNVAIEGGTGGQATMAMFGMKNMSREDYRDKIEVEIGVTAELAELVNSLKERRAISAQPSVIDADCVDVTDDQERDGNNA